MRQHLDLGCAPSHEDCAQVGAEGYFARARLECRAYIAQLRRTFGEEPDGASLSIKSNPHDFGTYLSVVCQFDPEIQQAVDYAFRCEAEGPGEWDEIARTSLRIEKGE